MVCADSSGVGCLIIIAGVPGTGKSSVGAELASLLDCPLEEISAIAHKTGVVASDPTERATGIVTSFNPILDKLTSLLGRGCVLLASHILAPILEGLGAFAPFVVVLRTHPLVLMERLKSRGWPLGKIAENVLSEFFGVMYDEFDWTEYPVVEIDTTQTTPREAAQRILDKIELWDVGRHVDWVLDSQAQDLAARLMHILDFDRYGFRV